jgi:hypothetical protein
VWSIPHRFRHVNVGYPIAPREIGNRSSDAQHAVEAARGEAECF